MLPIGNILYDTLTLHRTEKFLVQYFGLNFYLYYNRKLENFLYSVGVFCKLLRIIFYDVIFLFYFECFFGIGDFSGLHVDRMSHSLVNQRPTSQKTLDKIK